MSPAPKNALESASPVTLSPDASVVPAQSYEELQEQYEHLRERLQRCTTALASAAHDLKTPLAIISGYVDVLRGGKLGGINERQTEVLGDMASNCQRLQALIQDFLTFGALETTDIQLHLEVGDLNACLQEVCSLLAPKFQEKQLALYFLANEKLPLFPFDSAKIQRIVSNLLDNACKFAPSGGTVWLHAEPYMWERRAPQQNSVPNDRRRRSQGGPNSIKVSVADTGPGIAPEFHIEVFDDFFRVPQHTGMVEGTGLGLAIARRFVNAFGGKIWVESEPGNGCKFCFLVPLAPSSTLAPTRGKAQ